MIDEQIQNGARALHDLGLATWYGGQVFGKFSLNPVVRVLDDKADRGRIVNSAWFAYNPLGTAGLATAALVRVVARGTELRPERQTPAEAALTRGQDALMAVSAVLTALTAVQGVRLARQGDPPGAVPIETGTEPAPETPPQARRLQRSIDSLGGFNVLAGTGLIVLRAIQDRLAYSRPPARRALLRRA